MRKKGKVLMNYFTQIRQAVAYLENRLTETITLTEAAEAAGFSQYHFHRIFQTWVGHSLAEYVRRRRLTQASHELLRAKCGILDIAVKYQFESQASFTRAFRKMFDVNPGEYRKAGRRHHNKEEPIISEERLNHLYGGMPMEPRIVEKAAFKVVGMKVETKMSENKIPGLWEQFLSRIHEVRQRSNEQDTYGISEYSDNYVDECSTYWACVPVSCFEEIPEGMVAKTVSAARYVVVTHKGKLQTMGNAFDYIHTTWLPKSGYELAEKDGFELYGERFLGGENEKSEIELYIAIK
jgi:AraC family transcriptional regulator